MSTLRKLSIACEMHCQFRLVCVPKYRFSVLGGTVIVSDSTIIANVFFPWFHILF
ncbi:MAG: hypothetical protein P4L38_03730 [Syntrophaceae bacterium]|nr:hypothetical protein [Syntrophaceae bacterium]